MLCAFAPLKPTRVGALVEKMSGSVADLCPGSPLGGCRLDFGLVCEDVPFEYETCVDKKFVFGCVFGETLFACGFSTDSCVKKALCRNKGSIFFGVESVGGVHPFCATFCPL